MDISSRWWCKCMYADTICDLGFSAELGNYGEYSGALLKI